ncbi:MAG: hypothetical protein PHD81_04345 [Candidatus Nanoarchaeia archaeon]|nr:hypothetical protein [Candidatus Nanoarchaeia archaeon]MDD5588308.1 hypothetical protein [Candidatus Nanoarchaeia archaeon]
MVDDRTKAGVGISTTKNNSNDTVTQLELSKKVEDLEARLVEANNRLAMYETQLVLYEKNSETQSKTLDMIRKMDKLADSDILDKEKVAHLLPIVGHYTNLDYIYFELDPRHDPTKTQKPLEFVKLGNKFLQLTDAVKAENQELYDFSEHMKALRDQKGMLYNPNFQIDHTKVKNKIYNDVELNSGLIDGQVDVQSLQLNTSDNYDPKNSVGVIQLFKRINEEDRLLQSDLFIIDHFQITIDSLINRLWNLGLKQETDKQALDDQTYWATANYVGHDGLEKKEQELPQEGWEKESVMDKNKLPFEEDLHKLTGEISFAEGFDFHTNLGMDNPRELYSADSLYKISDLASKLVLGVCKDLFKIEPEIEISLTPTRTNKELIELNDPRSRKKYTDEMRKKEIKYNWVKAMIFCSQYALSAPLLKDDYGKPLSKPSKSLSVLTDALNYNLNKLIQAQTREKYADSFYNNVPNLLRRINDSAAGSRLEGTAIVEESANIVEACLLYAAYAFKSDLSSTNPELGKKQHTPDQCLQYLADKGYTKQAEYLRKVVKAPSN